MNRRMCFSRLRRVTTLFDSSVYACKLLERILKLVLKLAVFYTRLSHSARTKAARKTEKATNWKNPWLWLFQNKRCHRFLFFPQKSVLLIEPVFSILLLYLEFKVFHEIKSDKLRMVAVYIHAVLYLVKWTLKSKTLLRHISNVLKIILLVQHARLMDYLEN